MLDQLDGIEHIVSRPMFGGTGLYAGTVFFGIIFHDILYFKVDAQTRVEDQRVGMKPFTLYAPRTTTMQYYEIPGGRAGKRRGSDRMGAQGDRRRRAQLRPQQGKARRPCLTAETRRRKVFWVRILSISHRDEGKRHQRVGDARLRRAPVTDFPLSVLGPTDTCTGDGPAPFDTAQGVPSGVEGRGGQRKIGATDRKTASPSLVCPLRPPGPHGERSRPSAPYNKQ